MLMGRFIGAPGSRGGRPACTATVSAVQRGSRASGAGYSDSDMGGSFIGALLRENAPGGRRTGAERAEPAFEIIG